MILPKRDEQIPAIGLGTWKLTGDVARVTVQQAVELGYRHIDCAAIYENEADVGRALEYCLRGGAVSRDELWVTSKLWNDSHRAADVCPALEHTLRDLQLEWLDLYLIHWPVAHRPGVVRPEDARGFLSLDEVPLAETWQALDACREAGLCRHIGVSNFSVRKLQSLVAETGVVPFANQVESHPYLQQKPLLEYCNANDIVLTAYSPLGSADRPDGMKQPNEPSLFSDPEVKRIAASHGVSPAAVLIAWGVQRGTVVIPKATGEAHLRDNLAAAALELPPADMRAIAALDRHFRFVDGTFWELPGGPYTVANLWDEVGA